jgi:tetratricopeptide (TPR) repeat protein
MDPQDQAIRQLLEQVSKPLAVPDPKPPAPPVSGRKEYLAGQIQQAIPLLEKARTAGAHGNEFFFMLGNSYLQAHQIPKARAAFADLYGVPRESGAARLFTAQMLMRLEFEDDAQAELEAALAHEPKLPEAHFMLGEIAIYRAQIERAVDELNREIALNPGFAMAYYRLGDAYTRREDWEHAVPPLQRAVWLDPTYSGPYILLGKTYQKQGDLPEAERMLRRALQMDPKNASAHYLLGRTLIQSGHPEEGKKLLQRWEELRRESGQ